mmetsp:Transcript_11883/g.15550  ORF Transcript_11883/g.15550 Transcript_11883/m.15550 type:complete len:89 (+) Transcript_11883:57-323(+)
MNALGSIVTKFTNPSWYSSSFQAWKTAYGAKYIQSNSGVPIIHLMVVLGVVGYSAEYAAVGKYHVAHEKDTVAKAVAEYEAKHGSSHH